jgi:branched-chain amino acid transport system permease protein
MKAASMQLLKLPAATTAWLVLLALGLTFPFFFSDYAVFQVSVVIVYAVAIMGITLLTGFSGQISVGHGALMAIGAYAAAISIHRLGVPELATIPLSAGVCFLVGLVLGLPTLRLRGMHLALVTMTFALIMPPVLTHFDGLTGGAFGLTIPALQAPPAMTLSDSQWKYLVVLAVAAVAAAAVRNLTRGRIGRALLAIRQNEAMAMAMGISVQRDKVLVFALSSACAGAAGALYVLTTGFVSPDAFTFTLSINLFVAAIVGGLDTAAGALLGAAFIVLVPVSVAGLSRGAPQFVMAAAILLVIYAQPQGLAGALTALHGFVFRRFGAKSASGLNEGTALEQGMPKPDPVRSP